MDDNNSVGSVDNYSIYNNNRIDFVVYDISDECKKCILYPTCKGGCRAAELKQTNVNQCNVYKSCLDIVAEHLMDYYLEGGE